MSSKAFVCVVRLQPGLGLGLLGGLLGLGLALGLGLGLGQLEVAHVDLGVEVGVVGLGLGFVALLGLLGLVLGLLGRRLVGLGAVAGAHAGEVDAELLGGAQEVVVLVAHLGALALLRDDVDVERQRLHLLEQDLERLGDRRLGDVLALDDRLVGLHAPDRVVGLDREHLLQRVGGAVGLQGPDLHLAEALATELRLAAQRLLRDERVRA